MGHGPQDGKIPRLDQIAHFAIVRDIGNVLIANGIGPENWVAVGDTGYATNLTSTYTSIEPEIAFFPATGINSPVMSVVALIWFVGLWRREGERERCSCGRKGRHDLRDGTALSSIPGSLAAILLTFLGAHSPTLYAPCSERCVRKKLGETLL